MFATIFATQIFVSMLLIATTTLMMCAPAAPPATPNIILILTDDQGWGATSVQMDDREPASASDFIQTPNLEKLAARGLRFASGYAPHPNCSPSRCSILTGKSTALLKFTDIVGRNDGPPYEGNKLIPPKHINAIPDAEVTIAELIKQNRPEYATAHFGKWHLKGGGPERHGFDLSDGETGNREGSQKVPGNPKRIFGITDRGNAWMAEQVRSGKPFYLQLSHYATHLGIEALESTIAKNTRRTPGKRHNQVDHASMAEDLDTGVGRVLDQVEALGITDNTYIIYVADNGTYPLPNPGNTNGPLHGWKATAWEGGIRVPFIIAGPGIQPGQSNTRVVGYDLYPTICDMLNIAGVPGGVEGGSLLPVLTGDRTGAVSRSQNFLVFHWPHYQLQKASHPATAIYQGPYKLLKFWETGELRLFDLTKDLDETNNLAGSMPDKAEELHEKLMAYLKEIDAGMPVVNADYQPDTDPGKKEWNIKQRLLDEAYFILE
jgi:arylsulfatase A